MVETPNREGQGEAYQLFAKARQLYFGKRYDDALAEVGKLLRLDDGVVRGYCVKALCFAEMGRTGEALGAAEEAVRRDPGDAVAYSTRAFCRHRGGDDAGAEADYEKALRLEPSNYKVHYNAACYWSERANEEKCREHLAQGIELAPPGADFYIESDADLARYADTAWFKEQLLKAKLKARAA